MYECPYVTKSGWLSAAAAALIFFIGIPRASAATYTYNLTDLSGSITTSCDNCVLNSSNIVAWSMSVPGFISLDSTNPGAQVSVPTGDTDMVATPQGINFNFTGIYGGINFATPSASVAYVDAGPDGNIGFGPGFGIISECDNSGNCNMTGATEGTRAIAVPVVPFAGAVTYVFTGTVTSGSDEYASCVGTTVTGTVTIDFGAGDGALPVSFTTAWGSGTTSTTPRVMTSSLSGCVSFGYGTDDNNTAVVSVAPDGSSVPNEYDAYENDFLTLTRNAEAGQRLQFFGGTGPDAPFDANGLPVFANATGGAIGHVYYYSTGDEGDATYTITSFTLAVPAVSLSPQSLSFPSTVVGSTSAPLTVALKNTGTGDLSITSITLTGGQTDDFALSNTCGTSLAASATCTVSVTFKPVAAGTKQATFTVIDNAHGSQRSVAVTGTATAAPAPAVTLSATSLSFASQQVGTASSAQTVTLANTGTAALSISSIHITGRQADDFTLAQNCGTSLAAGKSCTLSVTFKPVAAGAKSATVGIVDNAHGSQRSVALKGTAL